MVKAEDSRLIGLGFIHHTEETIFRAPFVLDQKPGPKEKMEECSNQLGIAACAIWEGGL